MATRMILALIFGAAMIASCAAQSFSIPPIPPGYEARCILPGFAYLKGCEEELTGSLNFFKLKEVKILKGEELARFQKRVDDYIASGLGKPSPKCCKAFCVHGNEICTCEPVARNYTSSFFGGEDAFQKFVGYYVSECGVNDLYANCPDNPAQYKEENEPVNNCDALDIDVENPPALEPDADIDYDMLMDL